MPTVSYIFEHEHFCRACHSNWKHSDQECWEGYMYPEEYPCPICEDSPDPAIRELVQQWLY